MWKIAGLVDPADLSSDNEDFENHIDEGYSTETLIAVHGCHIPRSTDETSQGSSFQRAPEPSKSCRLDRGRPGFPEQQLSNSTPYGIISIVCRWNTSPGPDLREYTSSQPSTPVSNLLVASAYLPRTYCSNSMKALEFPSRVSS